MTARGFVESLANRATGNSLPIVIRPAISPEMIPDAFSAASQDIIVAPIPPSPKIEESVTRPPDAFVLAQNLGNKLSPVIQDNAVTQQKRNRFQDNISESKDLPRNARMDEKPFVSPSAPIDLHAELSSQKSLAEKKGDKETLVQHDAATPQILPTNKYKIHGSASRFALDNSKEISNKHDKDEYDNNNAVSSDSALDTIGPAQKKQQLQVKTAKEEEKEHDAEGAPPVAIRPEENQMMKEMDSTTTITTPHHGDKSNRADNFIIQQVTRQARQAMQAQSQAGHDLDNTVTINIGRIEVRAVFPQKQGPPTKEQSGVTLSQYLKLRSEGKI